MKQDRRLCIGVFLIFIVGGWLYLGGLELIAGAAFSATHGYDGIDSSVVGIENDYGIEPVIEDASAMIDPPLGWYPTPLDPTGLRIEIGGVNILSQEDIDEVEKVERNGDLETTTTLKVQKLKCTMGLTIQTYGEGAAHINNIIFWIKLEQNQFSVFTDAKETISYILNVYTRENAEENGVFDVIPESGGYDFPLRSTSSETVPDWILDAGYTTTLSHFRSVQFSVKVTDAAPDTFAGWFRTENQATLDIGIDVIVFGLWEHTKDVRDWIPPDVFDPLALFAQLLQQYTLIIVVAVAAGIIVFAFVKGRS